MNKTVLIALAISLAAIISSSCTKHSEQSGRIDKRACPFLMKEHHPAHYGQGHCRRHECRCGSREVIAPREFFDTGDFGRGNDSLYGGEHEWSLRDRAHNEAYGQRRHGACSRRDRHDNRCRHGNSPDFEDALSERYGPSMNHDTGYDE